MAADIHSPHFRVIIAGGGPVGLTLAHALAAAGIDYVILERHTSFTAKNGATVAILPHNVRVFNQLGLLQHINELSLPMHTKVNLGPDGTFLAECQLFAAIQKNHGHPWMLFHRPDLTKMLYDRLPDQSKALAGKGVEDIEITDSGVVVHCTDGSEVDGSVVIGADGVHSGVRQIMERLAAEEKPPVILNSQPAFKTTYLCLYGWLNPIPDVETGIVWEVRGKDVHFQIPSTRGRLFFLAYITLPEPRIGDDNRRFSEEETEQIVASIADNPVHPRYRFRDFWERRQWSYLTESKEGKIQDWHWGGRIALVGDAVHKMSAEMGFGFNTGMQSAVVLANELQKLSKDAELARREPTADDFEAAFTRYHNGRKRLVSFLCWTSQFTAKMLAWKNKGLEVLDRYIIPALGGDVRLADWVLALITRSGLVLDYLKEEGRKAGRVSWRNFPTKA